MDKDPLHIAKKECAILVNRILQEQDSTKEYKLFKLEEGLRRIEEELHVFKEEFIIQFAIRDDQSMLRALQKICLVSAKDCLRKLMCFSPVASVRK